MATKCSQKRSHLYFSLFLHWIGGHIGTVDLCVVMIVSEPFAWDHVIIDLATCDPRASLRAEAHCTVLDLEQYMCSFAVVSLADCLLLNLSQR